MGKKTFTENVHEVVKGIKKGQVLTYAQVARAAGSPRAFRAVGSILSRNWDKEIPCHRVIGSDGKMHGYNRGIKNKQKILREEGALR